MKRPRLWEEGRGIKGGGGHLLLAIGGPPADAWAAMRYLVCRDSSPSSATAKSNVGGDFGQRPFCLRAAAGSPGVGGRQLFPRRRISRPSGKRPGSGKSFLLGRLRATLRHRSLGPLPDFVICGCRYAFRLFTVNEGVENGVAACRDAKTKSPIERKVSGDETSCRGHFVRGPRNWSKELGKRNAFRPRRPRAGGTPIQQETRQTPYSAEKQGRGRGGRPRISSGSQVAPSGKQATNFTTAAIRRTRAGGRTFNQCASPKKSSRATIHPAHFLEGPMLVSGNRQPLFIEQKPKSFHRKSGRRIVLKKADVSF